MAAKQSDLNRQHHEELAGHLIDNAVAVGHGHMMGKQGAHGHDMPANHAHLQSGHYIPRAAMKDIPQPNDSGSSAADDCSQTGDYGKGEAT